jgi:hypothetical protein
MVNALKLSVVSSARPNRLDRMGGVPDTGTLVPFPTLSWFYPVGEMDSPLEPPTMTNKGTKPTTSGKGTAHTFDDNKLVELTPQGVSSTTAFCSTIETVDFQTASSVKEEKR